tara:strand:- start:585 stop:1406 length:822 start_codon:yes stop_codon:yes gene_type:complete
MLLKSHIWRDIIIDNLERKNNLFRYIFDKFREEMRNTTDNLSYMREESNIIYLPDEHNFYMLDYPWSVYPKNNYISYPKRDNISSGLIFEDFVKNKQMTYYINNLDMLYYNFIKNKNEKLYLKDIVLIHCIIPVLRYKYEKSYNSLYKFIYKIENNQLKNYRDKIITKINKKKIMKINSNLLVLRNKNIEKEKIHYLIEKIEKSYSHNEKVRNIKNQLILILSNYLNSLEKGETIEFYKFRNDMSLYIPNLNKLINYIPDDLFILLKNIVKWV